jgi:peptide/nickel transport system permease protein
VITGASGYLARRCLQVIPAVLTVLTATFILIHAAPGSPVTVLGGEQSSREYQAELTRKFGLDRPVPEQYLRYVTTLVRGDLGRSIVQGRPVLEVVGERLPATLLLILPAIGISAAVGVAVGMLAARTSGAADRLLIIATLLGQAVPVFVIGLLVILVFSVYLGALPVAGMRDLRESYTGSAAAVDLLRHLALPVATLAFGHAAVMARLTRAGVREEMSRPYAMTARAKGLGEGAVLWRHVLRNAANPIVTALGNETAVLLGGAVITERIFGWPGLGQLTLDAALSRDYPVLLGVVLVAALAVTLINLLVDLLYPLIDPRVALR